MVARPPDPIPTHRGILGGSAPSVARVLAFARALGRQRLATTVGAPFGGTEGRDGPWNGTQRVFRAGRVVTPGHRPIMLTLCVQPRFPGAREAGRPRPGTALRTVSREVRREHRVERRSAVLVGVPLARPPREPATRQAKRVMASRGAGPRAAEPSAPVQRVFRRRSALPAPPAPVQVDVPTTPRTPPVAPSPAEHRLPAGELQRVTDHVLRAIDARLSAYRERRGSA